MFRDATIPVPPLAHFHLLGRSGLKVSPLCLGTMNFGTNWTALVGECSKDEARKIFDKYVENGGNFVDTANKYQEGQSEEWLGEWMEEKGIRDSMVIATKFSLPIDMKNINSAGNSRKSLYASVEKSLKRLRTTYIDILYLHVYDLITPIEEWMKGLNDLVSSGKVLYLGISDTPAWVVSRANTIAQLRGWSPFVVYQGRYNALERDMETEIIPMCKELGLGIAPWSVLAQGKLTGRVGKADPNEQSRVAKVSLTDKEAILVEELRKIGEEVKKGIPEVALNWALRKGTFPILGARKLYQLESALEALTFTLSKEQVERIDKASGFAPGFPTSILGSDWKNVPFIVTNGALLVD